MDGKVRRISINYNDFGWRNPTKVILLMCNRFYVNRWTYGIRK